MSEDFRGRVDRRAVAAGSKSEHDAVVLVTDDGRELILRRLGGNPFADPELDALVGKTVRCTGELRGTTLIASDIVDEVSPGP